MNPQTNKKKSEALGLSLKDVFYKYVRFLPVFLLSVALALLIAFVYLRYSTSYYQTTGSMSIKTEAPQSGDRVETILSGASSNSNLQNEIEVLKSRILMARVVDKLNLQFSYTVKGKIKELNVYRQGPFLLEPIKIADSSRAFTMHFAFQGDKFQIDQGTEWHNFQEEFRNQFGIFKLVKTGYGFSEDAEYSVTWQPTMNVASVLSNTVWIMPKTPGTNILSVSYETTNSQEAADIVNTLMVEYDSMTLEQNNHSTDQRLTFIDTRLKILETELDTLQIRFLRYKQANNLIDVNIQLGDFFSKVSEADKATVEGQFMLMQAESIQGYLKDKNNRFTQVTPSALTIDDRTLNELVMSYNKLQLQRQSYIDAGMPPANPAIKEVEGSIESVRQGLVENLDNIKKSYQSTIGTWRSRSRMEEQRLQSLPFKLKEYVEMERQINTKLALYTLIEEKREEAAIARASTISNSEIIDHAPVNDQPVKPDRRTIQLIALLIGIALPALLIFAVELLNDKVTTRADIENISDAPIMGEVGHSYVADTLVVSKSSRSMVAEQFRIIRSNLQYVLNKVEKPVIMVTSSFSGEGKSFVSTNMGGVMALTGKRTVILEFDIRKPKILSSLGMPKSAGISNYLLGQASLKDVIIPIPNQENLFVLPCGPIPPNPSELLLDDKVDEMFKWLRENFDVIVIDTAPVGMVSDAMTLGKYADCSLYIVRQGHTYKKQIVLVDELFREAKLPKVSIVINDVKLKPGYGYYGYGRYAYGYGHKGGKDTYYEEDEPKTSGINRFLRRFDLRRLLGRKK
ncbi:MAG: polysaccharide biosynthesis tyrosine autokinase [Chitinophagaceae bacterium]